MQDHFIGPQEQIITLSYQRTDDVLRVLLRGEAEATLQEESVVREYLKKVDGIGENLKIAFTLNEKNGIAFGFRKDSASLRESVNTVLSRMKKDGRLDSLKGKWFAPVSQ